mmetsp:Transcript_6922/g.8746  ORF Transcript_6922/g.8746 Transcript_6922/m.8746 type:complete len:374 (-) Transcript_6922:195-1316(-)
MNKFMSSQSSSSIFRKILVVIKQTAYEEYSQLRLRGQAPKALRWKRLENRYKAHKTCVNNLLGILRHHNVEFECVNRVELDRQHLANVDLVLAVGGDGTALSAAHFLDHGTIPLLGINSDPIKEEDRDTKKKTDERRSHGALCMCTSNNMADGVSKVLFGEGVIQERTRIQCIVKSTFSETRLVPALNDLLICNPSPAAVSRFRMGWLEPVDISDHAPLKDGSKNSNPFGPLRGSSFEERATTQYTQYGTVTRFGNVAYDIRDSLNVWGSGIWLSTATGSTAAMAAAGGMPMSLDSKNLQYLIREHIYESNEVKGRDNSWVKEGEQLHLRWNSQKGTIFVDGSHMTHDLELGDEILISSAAPPLLLFVPPDSA